MSDLSDKIKDRKFQINVLVYAVIFIVVIIFLNWLIKSGQADRSKNQVENFNDYYKSLLAKCDKENEKIYDCCLDSVKYMAAANFELAGIGCKPGFKLNTFNCIGSYKWCEMIR
ncbi:hypothetical protein HY797_03155 [Candidatus Falkowbacteria bacterium]|nr:hypothetical protein [Candidatus Falkowbacteria bacterium]